MMMMMMMMMMRIIIIIIIIIKIIKTVIVIIIIITVIINNNNNNNNISGDPPGMLLSLPFIRQTQAVDRAPDDRKFRTPSPEIDTVGPPTYSWGVLLEKRTYGNRKSPQKIQGRAWYRGSNRSILLMRITLYKLGSIAAENPILEASRAKFDPPTPTPGTSPSDYLFHSSREQLKVKLEYGV
jgi:hypothetical protein